MVRYPVHPHVRGVYAASTVGAAPMGGTSPRAWGLWITKQTSWQTGTVHPHVRGVYTAANDAVAIRNGSSPRAWGLYRIMCFRASADRFIPTCVGFMLRPWQPGAPLSVHPHVRGVYDGSNHGLHTHDGSSPRAWGLFLVSS